MCSSDLEDVTVLSELLALVDYLEQRRAELDRQIAAWALTPAWQAGVAQLGCFRGLDTHAAMVLATELGDWQRFTTAGQLMAYVGLVPREDSSGTREHRGAIAATDAHRLDHVVGRPRDDDADRDLAVVGPARRVERAVAWLEPDLAFDNPREVVLQAAHVDVLEGGRRRGEAPVGVGRNPHQTA